MIPGYLRMALSGMLLFATPALASEPWDWSPKPSPAATARGAQDDFHLLKQGVRFFQRYISVVDGDRCPMYPTCSAYSLSALEKHGPMMGTFMTVDRLFHETDPQEHRHPMMKYGRRRFYDPLENNDFWLK